MKKNYKQFKMELKQYFFNENDNVYEILQVVSISQNALF